MTTYTAKTGEVRHGWYVVDAQNKVLGRLAAQIAARLRGKHKPQYTPHVDTGDYIVVVNAAKLRVTGRKPSARSTTATAASPDSCTRSTSPSCTPSARARAADRGEGHAAQGPLGYAMLKKLKVYGGATHPHSAQQPKALEI